jgi:hypothetical protein
MSAVLLARVRAFGGQEAVTEVLRQAGSQRTLEYLLDITNWIAYDEAVALWQAGGRVTQHPQFARAVGVDAARRLAGSQVAAMLRSLGSPEKVYRAIATSSAEFSTVTKLEVSDAGPGFAEVVAVAADGFPRSVEHCAWTCGLLTCPTALFGHTWTSSSGEPRWRIQTPGWSCRSARAAASTDGCWRFAEPARAFSPRSESCSRSMRDMPRARSMARRP